MDEKRNRQDALGARIRQCLVNVQAQTARLQKTNTWLLIFSVVSSAAATFITGITAALGPVVGSGPEGWRISCIAGAVFALISTVCVGLDKQLKTTNRLAQANQALGRLRFLDLAVDTGSRSWEEITKEFEALYKTYPEIVT